MARGRRWIQAGAVAGAGAVLVTLAVVLPGYDEQNVPVDDGTVWALRSTGDDTLGTRYGRLNLDLRELDTVKLVQNPTSIVQAADQVLLYTNGLGKVTTVDQRMPQDIDDTATDPEDTPAGTTAVVAEGEHVAYLAGSGQLYLSTVGGETQTAPVLVDPYAEDVVEEGESRRQFGAAAIALGLDGVLYAYSPSESAVLRYRIDTGEFTGTDAVTDGPEAGAQLTAIGDRWVLVSDDSARVWMSGSTAPRDTGVTGTPALQRSGTATDAAYLATDQGLYRIDAGTGTAAEVVAPTVVGTPAQPAWRDGALVAAWLPVGAGPGSLWSAAADDPAVIPLDYGGRESGTETVPRFIGSGGSTALNETALGWVWTVPDGDLVPSSQTWDDGSDDDNQPDPEDDQVAAVVDAKPPVAVDDEFGVRAGSQVVLPILLNDYDPNDDVLTVSLADGDGNLGRFGSVSVTNNGQELTVDVAAGASGTASLEYRLSDGTREWNPTPTATVRLTVVGGDTNTAPVFCATEADECRLDRPDPEVAPGGTAIVDVLDGWFDPEGDPFFLEEATVVAGDAVSLVTPDGTLYVRHTKPTQAGGEIQVEVRVSDLRGRAATETRLIRVTEAPRLAIGTLAAVAGQGEPLTIDLTDRVFSAHGTAQIRAIRPVGSAESTVEQSGNLSFEFSSTSTGTHLFAVTVSDESTQIETQVRVTVYADSNEAFSVAPVTVFIRPKLDTTIDIASALSNPSGKVVVIDRLSTSTVDSGGYIDAQIVGTTSLRVRGNTGDGDSGRVGSIDYRLTDGTGNARGQIEGEAQVYLLPQREPQAPIATNDAVTVRAGAQIDIPVLENDAAPHGESIVLDPSTIRNESEQGLAFATTTEVRYLAPSAEGVYRLSYDIYTAGAPTYRSTAFVDITVLASSAENHAPQPVTLRSKVISGQSVAIPFRSFGIDPDGDSVRLDQIVQQPESGIATIAADGEAIIYTSLDGVLGPDEFVYQVRDARGLTGQASVRVSVLDSAAGTRPITASDYVELRVGADSQVVIRPLQNDSDPLGGRLSLVSVQPDLPRSINSGDTEGSGTVDNPEYLAMQALLTVNDDGSVQLSAGETTGYKVFSYEVANEVGSTAKGYIVLRVVRDSVADLPQIADTALTVEQLNDLPRGVDVLTGKVTWNSGDWRGLELSLWRSGDAYTVSGTRISGEVPEYSELVPFQVTGTNYAGETVTGYGFLKVPGTRDLVLALREGAPVQSVDEHTTGTFDMAQLVAVPQGSSLQVDAEGVRASGARVDASCAVESGTSIRYTAEGGQPWSDSCAVPVRLPGQDAYTTLAVPISIVPENPAPELLPIEVEISPGDPERLVDLQTLVRWPGLRGDAPPVTFSVQRANIDNFEYEGSDQLRVLVDDTAVVGEVETIAVSLVEYPEVSTVVSLRVGPAPTSLPRAADAAIGCRQSQGSSCDVKVTGVRGEFNNFRTQLKVNAVDTSQSTCDALTFAPVGTETIRISWTDQTPGQTCEVLFSVEDARGKVSTGDGNGTLSVDFLGYARPVESVQQVAYGNLRFTLNIVPGEATRSYPAVTEYRVYERGGSSSPVATCTTPSQCVVTTTENGDQTVYEVVARNAEGNSREAAEVEAWSYRPPTTPSSLSVQTVYDASRTTGSEGAARITIANTGDASLSAYSVSRNGSQIATITPGGGANTVYLMTLPVGPHSLTIEPLSIFEQPPGSGPVSTQLTRDVTVAGLPSLSGSFSITEGETQLTVDSSLELEENYGSSSPVRYVLFPGSGAAATCTFDTSSSSLQVAGALQNNTTGTFGGLADRTTYRIKACATNGFGVVETAAQSALVWNRPTSDQVAAYGPFTYDVLETARSASGVTFSVVDQNTHLPLTPEDEAIYDLRILGLSDSNSNPGQPPTLRAVLCLEGDSSRCGESVSFSYVSGNRRNPAVISGVQITGCSDDGVSIGYSSIPGGSSTRITDSGVRFEYQTSEGGSWNDGDNGTNFGDGWFEVGPLYAIRNVSVTVQWNSSHYNGLADFETAFLTEPGDARLCN